MLRKLEETSLEIMPKLWMTDGTWSLMTLLSHWVKQFLSHFSWLLVIWAILFCSALFHSIPFIPFYSTIFSFKKIWFSPGHCGSVGWRVLPCLKGRTFDYQPGHMPRLWVPSLLWTHTVPDQACMEGNQSMLVSCIDVSLPSSLSKKTIKNILGRG